MREQEQDKLIIKIILKFAGKVNYSVGKGSVAGQLATLGELTLDGEAIKGEQIRERYRTLSKAAGFEEIVAALKCEISDEQKAAAEAARVRREEMEAAAERARTRDA